MNHESSARLPQGTWQTQITTRGLAGPQRKICAGARGSENSTRALERPGISCASASRHANNSLPSALSAPIEFAFGHSRYHVTDAPPPPTPAPVKKSYAQTIVGKRDLYPKTRRGATYFQLRGTKWRRRRSERYPYAFPRFGSALDLRTRTRDRKTTRATAAKLVQRIRKIAYPPPKPAPAKRRLCAKLRFEIPTRARIMAEEDCLATAAMNAFVTLAWLCGQGGGRGISSTALLR